MRCITQIGQKWNYRKVAGIFILVLLMLTKNSYINVIVDLLAAVQLRRKIISEKCKYLKWFYLYIFSDETNICEI